MLVNLVLRCLAVSTLAALAAPVRKAFGLLSFAGTHHFLDLDTPDSLQRSGFWYALENPTYWSSYYVAVVDVFPFILIATLAVSYLHARAHVGSPRWLISPVSTAGRAPTAESGQGSEATVRTVILRCFVVGALAAMIAQVFSVHELLGINQDLLPMFFDTEPLTAVEAFPFVLLAALAVTFLNARAGLRSPAGIPTTEEALRSLSVTAYVRETGVTTIAIRLSGCVLGAFSLWAGLSLLRKTAIGLHGPAAYSVATAYLAVGSSLVLPWSRLPILPWRAIVLTVMTVGGIAGFLNMIPGLIYALAHGAGGPTLLFLLLACFTFAANLVLCAKTFTDKTGVSGVRGR